MTAATSGGMVEWAEAEIRRAGLFDEDSDYGGMLGPVLLGMVEKFCEAGHSGASAAITAAALEKLLRYEPLTPLTSDPEEWQHIAGSDERLAGDEDVWQSRRNPACFSNDGGKTYSHVDDEARTLHESLAPNQEGEASG